MGKEAFCLASYEMIIVSFFVIIYSRKIAKTDKNEEINRLKNYSLSKRAKYIIILLLLYIVVVLIATPQMLKEAFFLTLGRSEESSMLHYSGEVNYYPFGIPGAKPFATLSFTIFRVLQSILPIYIITRICNRIRNKTIRKFLVCIVILLTALVCTEERAHAIECALALIITVNSTYDDDSNDSKVNVGLLVSVIVCVVTIGLISKSGITGVGTERLNELSVASAAYFNGPNNVASAIALKETNSNVGIWNIIPDTLLHIPYMSKLFTGIWKGTINTEFNNTFGTYSLGQIIPSIGMGAIYFGYILSPLVPCTAIFFAMFFHKKALVAKDIFRRNLYDLGMIMMCRAATMSNMLSGITYLCNILIVYFFIYLIIKKGIKHREELSKR